MIEFELTDQPIDPDALRRRLSQSACGAVVTFEGRVRDHNRGRPVDRIVYEAYAPVAIAEGLAVHRSGTVEIGDLAVWIGVSAPHRAAAFAGCAGVIDTLKARVPIWKHEHYRDGGPEWLHPLP